MNYKNVRTMAVAAVVIVLCLLYSWVQYGDAGGDGGQTDDSTLEGVDGTWSTVYTYIVGDGYLEDIPSEFEFSYEDGRVYMDIDGDVAEFVTISDYEAVWTGGYTDQLYMEDGYVYYVAFVPGSGLAYIVMSRDGSASLPSDTVDLAGFQAPVTASASDGSALEGTLTVESNYFHVARGTVALGSAELSFTGFVKSDGERSVIVGVCDADGSSMVFCCVIEGGEAMFSTTAFSGTLYAGGSDGTSVTSGDGTLAVGGATMDLTVDGGLAYASDGSVTLSGAVMWTMEGEIVVLSQDVVAVGDGREYAVVAGVSMV